DEAVYFHGRLREKRMPLLGIVVNRLHPDPAAPTSAARRAGREPEIDADLEARLLEIYRDEQTVARADRKRVGRLGVDRGERPLLVPELESDVHALRGLLAVGDLLFGAPVLAGARRASS